MKVRIQFLILLLEVHEEEEEEEVEEGVEVLKLVNQMILQKHYVMYVMNMVIFLMTAVNLMKPNKSCVHGFSLKKKKNKNSFFHMLII